MNNKLKIREFILDNLTVFEEEAEFSDSDNIFELGYVNSLFAMKLLNYIENDFNILIENADINISNFSSIDNIASLIDNVKAE